VVGLVTERPIKVLHVITGLRVGGAERMLVSVATAPQTHLSQSVVALIGGPMAEPLRSKGVALEILDMGHGPSSLAAVFRLVRLIRRERPDVMQSWMYHADVTATLSLIASGLRRHVRLVWGLRSSNLDMRAHSVAFRLVRRLWLGLSSTPDLVIANSASGVDVHMALGAKPRVLRVIPNGVDTSIFKPDAAARARLRAEWGVAESADVLVHVARVDPMKDHATFLAVMDRLDRGSVHGVLVGTGTQTLPRRANVIALGERHDLPAVYAAGDVVISSSAYGEGFSNTLAEGMACGLPAVATDVGDARTIVGDTGVICPPRDVEALAEAARGLLKEPPAARTRRSEAARRRIVESFSLDQAIAGFTQAYRDVVGAA